jgi:hypothetical protein
VTRHVSFRAWRADQFHAGTHVGTAAGPRGLRYDEDAGCRAYTDPFGAGVATPYEWTSWLSPEVDPGHPFTTLVPSWNARTPDGSWLEIEARTTEDGVHWGRWWVLARWAETDTAIHPTTVPGQADDRARVEIEELVAADGLSWSGYQLRVSLMRPAGGDAVPTVSLVGAVVSAGEPVSGDPGGAARGLTLPVPAYSQQIHRGEYPHLDSGGSSWCSPTSTAMVLGTWGLGPSEEEYAWVDTGYADRFVDHAARSVYDHAYGGAGNWSFNTAYAALHGVEAFVTRLRSLAEVERFIAAGIPLVASVAFERDELPGAGYRTSGHLLVIVGFDGAGDVIVNDPASHELPSNDEVRVVYPRAPFEKVWKRSGCLVYVLHPVGVPLPRRTDPANW